LIPFREFFVSKHPRTLRDVLVLLGARIPCMLIGACDPGLRAMHVSSGSGDAAPVLGQLRVGRRLHPEQHRARYGNVDMGFDHF